MNLIEKAVKPAVVATFVATSFVTLAPPASAQSDPLQTAVTLTDNGFCVGHIEFLPVFGVNTPYWGLITNLIGIGPCSVDVFVNWRNADSGATGTVRHRIYGPGGGGSQISFDPGNGRVAGTITTSALHKVGTFEFQRG